MFFNHISATRKHTVEAEPSGWMATPVGALFFSHVHPCCQKWLAGEPLVTRGVLNPGSLRARSCLLPVFLPVHPAWVAACERAVWSNALADAEVTCPDQGWGQWVTPSLLVDMRRHCQLSYDMWLDWWMK